MGANNKPSIPRLKGSRVDCIHSSLHPVKGWAYQLPQEICAPPKSENHLSALMCPPPDRVWRGALDKRSEYNAPLKGSLTKWMA